MRLFLLLHVPHFNINRHYVAPQFPVLRSISNSDNRQASIKHNELSHLPSLSVYFIDSYFKSLKYHSKMTLSVCFISIWNKMIMIR